MKSLSEKKEKDAPATECAKHFKALMGLMGEKDKGIGWVSQCRNLMDTHSLNPEELQDFMTWAAKENSDSNPKFSSVDYLATATDPLVTLAKHASSLVKVWRVQRRSASVKRIADGKATSIRNRYALREIGLDWPE